MMRVFSCLLLLAFSASFAQTHSDSIELPLEKDLIPEGIACDAHAKRLFLNSLRKNKIVSLDLDGRDPQDIIESNQYGYLSGFGMTVKGDTLFALGNSLPKKNNTSILLLLNSRSGAFIKSFMLDDTTTIYLNDLAISSTGKVYITDSESNNIYTIDEQADTLKIFLSHDELKYSNGIAISDDNTLLYFATYTTGIRILDIALQRLVNLPNPHKGIDGMKFYKNSLIAIVNGKRDGAQNGIYRYHLNQESTEIIRTEKIFDLRYESDIPTTFDICDDMLYFIADSQLDNFDQDTNEIIDTTRLEPYQLIKIDLTKT
ncbi:SMP-30/gluconolactonase/LRE family protein [Allomuricauda sp. SCSIO 65647]|uniref:SMP-30/gluconolactonase/LRE family protein n=1 Tax=Allomuricauda sp. SCSIO 65647 TaxID=2908843 RepID=UPI001F33A210|nr:SMP-30/gluconolactonase/LRE family protein [Muricauda sp. SCSIO 65647]UJH68927.1 SMP-30/gluconolactonase/LRE family protein [Muricauda sp. SCSIO 65647]